MLWKTPHEQERCTTRNVGKLLRLRTHCLCLSGPESAVAHVDHSAGSLSGATLRLSVNGNHRSAISKTSSLQSCGIFGAHMRSRYWTLLRDSGGTLGVRDVFSTVIDPPQRAACGSSILHRASFDRPHRISKTPKWL